VKPRLAIAILCVLMLVIGMCGIVLSADLTKPWDGFSAADWGWLFVSWAGDVAIVYLVVEFIDEREWRKVKVKVMEQIRRGLTGITLDIAMVSGVTPVATFLPPDGTKEDEREAIRKAELEKMKRFAGDINRIRTEVKRQGFLFAGGYGPLFSHRAEMLAAFQLRYSKFLDAKLIVLMMDLEDHLKMLQSDVTIVQKGSLLASAYEEDGYRVLQALLKRIVEAVENGEIAMH
jgi:hypothetical protein